MNTTAFVAVPRVFFTPDPRLNPFHLRNDERTLFIYLLMNANWIESAALLPRQNIRLKRGQIAIGREKLAKDLRFSVQKTRTLLKHLETNQLINQQNNRLGSIITICNYDKITNSVLEINQETGQPFNSRATKEQPHHNKGNKETIKQVTPAAGYLSFSLQDAAKTTKDDEIR